MRPCGGTLPGRIFPNRDLIGIVAKKSAHMGALFFSVFPHIPGLIKRKQP
jgi:hypothetical protein